MQPRSQAALSSGKWAWYRLLEHALSNYPPVSGGADINVYSNDVTTNGSGLKKVR